MAQEILSNEPLPIKVRKRGNNRRFLTNVTLSTVIGLSSLVGIGILNKLTGGEGPSQTLPVPAEISPLTPIEEVPLASKGNIRVTYYDDNELNNYQLEVEQATVVAIEKDEKGKVAAFAVTVNGDKITRNCKDVNLNGEKALSCDFSGATLWFNITENTAVSETVNDNVTIARKGPDELGKTLKLGNIINYVGAGTAYFEGSYFGNLETVQENLHSLNNLKEKVGEKLPRADRSFSFVAASISI